MGTPRVAGVREKPTASQVVPPTVAPIVVAWAAATGVILFAGRNAMGTTPFVLVGSLVALLGCGTWLNHTLFRSRTTLIPFLGAVAATVFVWSWQKLVFASLIPSARLTYGYFLTPEGAHARLWILSCPFWVGLAA